MVDSDCTEMCVHDLVATRAQASPDALALASRDASLTYAQLDRRANQLANRLQSLGVGPEVLVGLCLERSPALGSTALGILKAGGAYLCLDAKYPDERIAYMLEDSKAHVLVTQASLAPRFRQASLEMVVLDDEDAHLDQESITAPASAVTSRNMAYVLYTSGSTGRPKGVMVEHSSLLNLIGWHDEAFAVTANDRGSQVASPSFDTIGWELWPYLVVGASVHFSDETMRGDARSLHDWFASEGITIGFLPTPVLEAALDLEWPSPALRVVLTGGDILYRRPRPGLPFVLYNNYGPTETTVVATSGPVSPVGSSGRPSIGKAISNFRLYVVDDRLQPVPIGTAGELLIGGRGLARGYLHQPELTRQKFVPDPFTDEPGARAYRTGDLVQQRFDGEIDFLGRVDDQINLRGFRVQPIEVTTVLDAHPGVRCSMVVPWDRRPGDRRLVGYVVPRDGVPPAVEELRGHLGDQLPYFMVPSHFVFLDELPLTPNGKVDRKALPAPEDGVGQSDGGRAPSTELETELAAMIAELLGVESVGVEDNFFLLGGHSLLAAQLVTMVRDRFEIEMPLISIFEAGTVARLAGEVERLRQSAQPTTCTENLAVVAQPSGTGPMLFFVVVDESDLAALGNFVRGLGPDQPVTGMIPPRERRLYQRGTTIPDMAATLLSEIRKHQQHGPYFLCGHSLGGHLVYEIAGQLRSQGEEVGWLCLLDSWAPDAIRLDMHTERQLVTRFNRFRARAAEAGLPATLRAIGRRRVVQLRASLRLTLAPDEYDAGGAINIVEHYHPAGHDAPLDIFVTTTSEKQSRSHALGWERVHHGVLRYHSVPGDHTTILWEPHERVLEGMDRLLREATETTSAEPARDVVTA